MNTDDKIMLFAIGILLFCMGGLVGSHMQLEDDRKAAIASGHAEYRVDSEGRVSFHWRACK